MSELDIVTAKLGKDVMQFIFECIESDARFFALYTCSCWYQIIKYLPQLSLILLYFNFNLF